MVFGVQAQEEAEDSDLLVDYFGSMQTGGFKAKPHSSLSHGRQSDFSFGQSQASSRQLRPTSAPTHPSPAQPSDRALLFDIEDSQPTNCAMPFDIADEEEDRERPKAAMAVDIADSPAPQSGKPRMTDPLHAAPSRPSLGQACHGTAPGSWPSAQGQPSRTASKAATGTGNAGFGAYGQAGTSAGATAKDLTVGGAQALQRQPPLGAATPCSSSLMFDIDDDDDDKGSPAKSEAAAGRQAGVNPAVVQPSGSAAAWETGFQPAAAQYSTTTAQHGPDPDFESNDGGGPQPEGSTEHQLMFDIDDDHDRDQDGNHADVLSNSRHHSVGHEKLSQPNKGLCSSLAAASGLLVDISDDDTPGSGAYHKGDAVLPAASGHHLDASCLSACTAARPAPHLHVHDKEGQRYQASASLPSGHRSDARILASMAAPFAANMSDADDDFQPSSSAAQLHARIASNHQASTSSRTSEPPACHSRSLPGRSQQLTSAAAAATPLQAVSLNASVAQHHLQQQQQQQTYKPPQPQPDLQQQRKHVPQQQPQKSKHSFKPPRRVSPPLAAKAQAVAAGQAGVASSRPLKRLRKAGQLASPVSTEPTADAEYGKTLSLELLLGTEAPIVMPTGVALCFLVFQSLATQMSAPHIFVMGLRSSCVVHVSD